MIRASAGLDRYVELRPIRTYETNKAGADLNAQAEYEGLTPLHFVAQNNNPAVVTALLKSGLDLHARDQRGLTPLHWAAWKNKNPAVITTLLDAGADPMARTLRGSIVPAEYARRNAALNLNNS